MKFEEIFESFKKKQQEIVELHKQLKDAQAKAQAEVDKLMEEKKKDLNELQQKFTAARENYKAELKAQFGITDGEEMNVLDMIHAVKKACSLE